MQVAQLLADAAAAGRLPMTEYEARLTKAYGAKTYDDLERLSADLPGSVTATRRAARSTGSVDAVARHHERIRAPRSLERAHKADDLRPLVPACCHGPRTDARRRLHGDLLGLGRAVRLPRPGRDAGLRRLRSGAPPPSRWNALPVLEDIDGPGDHPLGGAAQALGPRGDLPAGGVEGRCPAGQRTVWSPPSADAVTDGAGSGEPQQIGPRTELLDPEIEQVIEQVDRQHLSYLGVTRF